MEVERLKGIEGLPDYLFLSNSECRDDYRGSQTVGDKLHSRKGNSPDRRLRSLNRAKWERKWLRTNNQEVGLEAAIL